MRCVHKPVTSLVLVLDVALVMFRSVEDDVEL